MIDLTARFIQREPTYPKSAWAIHHSAGPERFASEQAERAHIDFIDRYHREERHFAVGIGYHVVVFESGRAYRVGKPKTLRAHVLNRNHVYDGLCFIGTFMGHQPSQAALEAAAEVIRESGMTTLVRHGDVQPEKPTACPGTWDLDVLRELVEREELSPPLNSAQRWMLGYVFPGKQVRALPQPMDGGAKAYRIEVT